MAAAGVNPSPHVAALDTPEVASECVGCGSVQDSEMPLCHLCGADICAECLDGEPAHLNDGVWINLKCESCGRPTCRNCLRLCYTCVINAEPAKALCAPCAEKEGAVITREPCKYHVWYSCERHTGCAECGAYYAGKHAGW